LFHGCLALDQIHIWTWKLSKKKTLKRMIEIMFKYILRRMFFLSHHLDTFNRNCDIFTIYLHDYSAIIRVSHLNLPGWENVGCTDIWCSTIFSSMASETDVWSSSSTTPLAFSSSEASHILIGHWNNRVNSVNFSNLNSMYRLPSSYLQLDW